MTYTTSISLDAEAAGLETRMKQEGKNFSAFVRECLFLYYREEHQECRSEATKTAWKDCEPFCSPTALHFCRSCWPDGTPDLDDLKKARRHVRELVRLRTKPRIGSPDPRMDQFIEGFSSRGEENILLIQEEPSVLEWLHAQAVISNRFVGSLAGMEIPTKSIPAKAEKPRSPLWKRILRVMAQ